MARLGLKLILMCLISESVLAYEVHPLVHQIDLADGRLTSSLTIKNTADRQLALDISVRRLELVDGKPFAGKYADEEVLVFPPAALIPPAGAQVVRIQLVPDTELSEDISYLVVVEELPDPNAQTGVQMLLAFNAIVYVLGADNQPDVKVTSTRLQHINGVPSLEIELHNSGTGNAYGRGISLELIGGTDKYTVSAAELSASVSNLFLPPNYRRSFIIPVPDELSDRQFILVTADYELP